MPQPVAVDDVIQTAICCDYIDEPFQWVRHFLATAVGSGNTFLDDLATWLENVMLPVIFTPLVDTCIGRSVYISRVAPQPINVLYKSFVNPPTGSVTSDGIPNTAAAVAQLTTNEVGPRNRGRVYIPGIAEVDTKAGLIKSASFVALEAAFQGFLLGETVAANRWDPVVFSRTAYGPTPPPPHPAAVQDYTAKITFVSLQGNLGTQRRRRFAVNQLG